MKQMTINDYLMLKETPESVDIKGICDDGYCPECNTFLDDLINECPYCGQVLDWSDWIRLNKEYI